MQKYPYFKDVGFSDAEIEKIYKVTAEYTRRRRKKEQLTKQEIFKSYGFSEEDINRFYQAESKNIRDFKSKKQNKEIDEDDLPKVNSKNKKKYLLYHDHGFSDIEIEKIIDVQDEFNQKNRRKLPVDLKELYRQYGFSDEDIEKIFNINSSKNYEKQKNKADEADIFLNKLRRRLLDEKQNIN